MKELNNNLFSKLARYGVMSRDEVRNDAKAVRSLVRRALIKKVYRRGHVFYQLTEKSLSLLDEYRQLLVHQARFFYKLHPRSVFYHFLLEDLRFLDEKKKEARQFLFLGDWQLTRPPNRYQLALSQLRYFEEHDR